MRTFTRVSASLLFLTSPLSLVSRAGTDSANLEVSASVAANCTIATSALTFGAYDPVDINSASPLVGSGAVTVRCTLGSSVVVELDEGANGNVGSAPDAPLRRLVDGRYFLAYDLFSNEARTAVWGVGNDVDVPVIGTGTDTQLVVYGAVQAGQNVPAGAYTDTVVATVTF